MAKIFQVAFGICHWDATSIHPSLDSILPGQYPPDILFVEAPDHVHEGWGYDEETATFIQPEPPDGWLYDPVTNTFYQDVNYIPPEPPIDYAALLAEADNRILDLEVENIMLKEGLS